MSTVLRTRARRAYELARVRTGLLRGLVVALAVALAATLSLGTTPLAWLPVSLAAWALVEWRGGAVRRGGIHGLVAGAATLLVPLAWLHPCCRPGAMMTGDCCARPGPCLAIGVLLGLVCAASLRVRGVRERVEGSVGMALGVGTVAVAKCTALFTGEAVGLVAGLLAGVVVAQVASFAWASLPHAHRD